MSTFRPFKSYDQGKYGEKIALQYLQRKGYKIILQNYRIKGGEIDLILQKNNQLIFVEVKARFHFRFGKAEESITNYKKKILLRTIHSYLYRNALQYKKWRCDVITLHFISLKRAYIQHFINIFAE